jgi:hypothetical protein
MGQAANLMKIYYLNNPLYYYDDGSFSTFDYNLLKKSMINQYNYIGDPAIEMHKVAKSLTIRADNQTPAAGDSINITITGGINSGTGRVEITDHEAHRLLDRIFGYSGETGVGFRIPDTLGGQSLYVRAYAGNGIEDANGYLEIGVEKTILKDVAAIPKNPSVDDSISFRVSLKSHFDVSDMVIKNFYYIDENNNIHSTRYTVNMKQVSDTLYESVNKFPGFGTPGLKYYDIIVHDSQGTEYRYRWKTLFVRDDRPNLSVISGSEKYGGVEKLKFEFKVKNETENNIDTVRIVCYQLSGSDSVLFSDAEYAFASEEEKKISVDFTNQNYEAERTFKIVIDPMNLVNERDEEDNTSIVTLKTDHFFVSKNIGTSLDGVHNDTLTIDNTWKFYAAPKSISASSVILLRKENLQEYIEKSSQKDLRFISLEGQTDTTALDVVILNNNCKFFSPAELTCRLDTSVYDSGDLRNVSSFAYDTQMGLWVKQASSKGVQITTPITKSGLFGVYYFEDEKYPIIEITTNGRPLANNMLIPDKPSIAILLQDENGINFKNSFVFKIDGEDLPEEDIAVPDTLNNPNYISVIASPDLTGGKHSLRAEVQDINGNTVVRSINFSVSDDFQIQVYGNYPNPFQDETIISYNIISNNTIDEISVKIYSVSGRLVRSKPLILDETIGTDHDIKTVGYHEIIWDGTDDDNVPAANGVYFLIFTGKYGEKTVTKTLKVAKLR